MIKFFRKIRQGLLAEGKLSKYLLYAIGETLLVVIGILIALQINNWNEVQKQQRQQQIYLNRLGSDIEDMITEYQGFKIAYEKWSKEAWQTLQMLDQCTIPKEMVPVFERTLISHQVLRSYISRDATYHEMVSSGTFANMKNDSLKLALSQLYSSLDDGITQVVYFRNDLGRASDIIWHHVSFSPDKENNLKVTYNLSILCVSAKFKNAMAEVYDSRRDFYDGINLYLETLNHTRHLLQSELSKPSS